MCYSLIKSSNRVWYELMEILVMTQEIYTEDLSKFGAREREILGRTLLLPFPDNFENSEVRAALNMNSGNVFLVNSDYQVAMINPNNGKLELFHSTFYDGHEGFLSDLVTQYGPNDMHADDVEYIRQQAEYEHFDLPENWQIKNGE